jgi:pimeloyl-ACP methyl ester carboxylesterase
MIEDISAGLDAVTVPVSIIVGSLDRVERESTPREVFGRILPQATFRVLDGIGHLSPLEAPDELADACLDLLTKL